MKIKLFNNLLLKVLSVITAVMLWLIVVNINDAVGSRPMRNIKVNVQGMEVLSAQGQMCRIEEGTDTVDLTVYARRSVLNDLKPSDFVVTADLQKNLLYDSMVKIEVSYVGNATVDRIVQSRENVLVSIEESVTEQFKVSVDTKGEPTYGLVKGSAIPAQTLIEITGPRSVVERINKVALEPNITGITGTMVRNCEVKLYDMENRPIDGTYLEYIGKDTGLEVTITTLNTKLVGISFDVSQAAPEGYGLNTITYTPETVTIAGIQKSINPVYNLNIPAEALNPDRQTGKVVQSVDISQYLDEGITIPDENDREIVVTMEIVPFESVSYVFRDDQIQYMNIREGLKLDEAEARMLEVTVSGLASDLAGVTMENITVAADLSQCGRRGVFTVPVTVTVPDKCHVPEDLQMTVMLVDVEGE
ncbi:MAG TPA: hypothetical protein DD414_11840 [Lachnospiraceae bacterium]|nr:hypothetical protein [Lachnospiraceae bacterium]